MYAIGQMMRETVSGVRGLLAARDAGKEAFGIERTHLKRHSNNILKFAPSDQDAIHQLLDQSDPGFLPAPEAIRLAIADIRDHDMSVLKTLTDAIAELLHQLHPSLIEQSSNARATTMKTLPSIRKTKCWDTYESHYREITDEVNGNIEGFIVKQIKKSYSKNRTR